MLQHPGPGDGPVLGDVPGDEDGDVAGLGPLHEPQRALSHLGDAPGSRGHVVQVHGLDRIDDRQAGLHLVEALKDIAQVCLGEEGEPPAGYPQALGPELDLLG